MRVIPMQVVTGEYSVFVIFEDENIERLKAYDPGELNLLKLGHPWNGMKIRDVVLMYATAEEIAMLDKTSSAADIKSCLRVLCRGWKYHPELGDHDGPYFGRNIKDQ